MYTFEDLHKTIPFARFGKEKSLEFEVYPDVTIAMPGRHAEQTSPRGGDFVVMVTDKAKRWNKHQFKHDDIFKDIERRRLSSAVKVDDFMSFYLSVIAHDIAPDLNPYPNAGVGHVLNNLTFFRAVQCLAVAEHRRYSQHEQKFGGRFLPFRFAAGIAEGLWSAQDAIDVQKFGRPSVEKLEKTKGTPALTKILMGS